METETKQKIGIHENISIEYLVRGEVINSIDYQRGYRKNMGSDALGMEDNKGEEILRIHMKNQAGGLYPPIIFTRQLGNMKSDYLDIDVDREDLKGELEKLSSKEYRAISHRLLRSAGELFDSGLIKLFGGNYFVKNFVREDAN